MTFVTGLTGAYHVSTLKQSPECRRPGRDRKRFQGSSWRFVGTAPVASEKYSGRTRLEAALIPDERDMWCSDEVAKDMKE